MNAADALLRKNHIRGQVLSRIVVAAEARGHATSTQLRFIQNKNQLAANHLSNGNFLGAAQALIK